jgi:hypothetical protein
VNASALAEQASSTGAAHAVAVEPLDYSTGSR